MDIRMPVMDGNKACLKMRQWEKKQGVELTPIIALTAHALKGAERKSLEAGFTAYLSKPIKRAALLESISEKAKTDKKSLAQIMA